MLPGCMSPSPAGVRFWPNPSTLKGPEFEHAKKFEKCGRAGCEAEPCVCGYWLEQPRPELVVDVDGVIARAQELLAAYQVGEVTTEAKVEEEAPQPWT
jgi:hypothetical protein